MCYNCSPYSPIEPYCVPDNFCIVIYNEKRKDEAKEEEDKSRAMLPLPVDRTASARRSSSIICRTAASRRTSTYVSHQQTDPLKVSLTPGTATVRSPNSDPIPQLIIEINTQVALFRDMLVHVGQAKDCPELRERIRKLRRTLVDLCNQTTSLILPQIKT